MCDSATAFRILGGCLEAQGSRVIIRVTPFRVLTTLLIAHLVSPAWASKWGFRVRGVILWICEFCVLPVWVFGFRLPKAIPPFVIT